MRVSRNEALTLQQKADILLLPVTFQVRDAEVETLYPSKILEYMNAGKPILICAPAHTFIYRHATKHRYAALLDSLDKTRLDSFFQRLFKDTLYRKELIERAYEYLRRHAWENVVPAFKRSLQEAVKIEGGTEA